jgi:DNA-binding NtrC family response regulator
MEMVRRPQPTVLVVADDYAAEQLIQIWDRHYEVLAVRSIVDALIASELRAPTVVVVDPTTDRGGGRQLLAAMEDSFPATLRIAYTAASRSELVGLLESGIADGAVSRALPPVHLARLIEKFVRLLQLGTATPRSSRRLRRLAMAGALQ